MSLVNDMLKDLDARRRGAPVKGDAAKKLTPASDRRGITGSSRLSVIIVAVVAFMVVSLVLWLLLSDRGDTGQLADLRNNIEASEPAPSTSQGDQSASSANANSDSATIAALEARLAELEAANGAGNALNDQRSTQPSTQQSSNQQRSDWNPVNWADNNQPAAQTATTNASADSQQPAITANSFPINEPQLPQSAASAAPQPPADEPVIARQSREMPLSERDRLQVQEALTLWSQGQQLAALQILDGFAYENPEAHQSRETLAKLLIRQGETERALQAADVGLQIAPSHPGYKKVKARILLGQPDVPQALALLAATPPSVANDPEYHNLLATAQLAGGEYTDAIQSYRALLRLGDPRIDTAPLLYGLGSAHLRIGNAAEARQAYQQALQQPELSANLRAQIERRLASPVPAQQ